MRAYLVFTALREKKISPEQQVTVSTRAWRAPGSRMFVEPRRPVAVDELIRGMVVQSGNDACIALAEATAGSEEVFAQMMNREAARLGMKNTHFMNSPACPMRSITAPRRTCTCSPRFDPGLSGRLRPVLFAEGSATTTITQPNRNRLLWLDRRWTASDRPYRGGGLCLIASSRRGGRRLLSVLLGSRAKRRARQERRSCSIGASSSSTA